MKKLIALGNLRQVNDLMCRRFRLSLSSDWSRRWKVARFGWLAASLGLIASFSYTAAAADFGLGLSVKSNDATIYFPIGVSSNFLIEPSINYAHTEFETSGQLAETSTLTAGAGFFGQNTPDHSVRLYYGARAAYVETKQRTSTLGSPLTTSRDRDGYRITPTVGFEYLFNDHLSLGGEAGYAYTDLDEDTSDGTVTNVILRYRF